MDLRVWTWKTEETIEAAECQKKILLSGQYNQKLRIRGRIESICSLSISLTTLFSPVYPSFTSHSVL